MTEPQPIRAPGKKTRWVIEASAYSPRIETRTRKGAILLFRQWKRAVDGVLRSVLPAIVDATFDDCNLMDALEGKDPNQVLMEIKRSHYLMPADVSRVPYRNLAEFFGL